MKAEIESYKMISMICTHRRELVQNYNRELKDLISDNYFSNKNFSDTMTCTQFKFSLNMLFLRESCPRIFN